MKRKIEALQNSIGSGSELEAIENEEASNPELEKLLTENCKLKYQVATLKRVRGFTLNFDLIFKLLLIMQTITFPSDVIECTPPCLFVHFRGRPFPSFFLLHYQNLSYGETIDRTTTGIFPHK